MEGIPKPALLCSWVNYIALDMTNYTMDMK